LDSIMETHFGHVTVALPGIQLPIFDCSVSHLIKCTYGIN
jgi:hypothetical protein